MATRKVQELFIDTTGSLIDFDFTPIFADSNETIVFEVIAPFPTDDSVDIGFLLANGRQSLLRAMRLTGIENRDVNGDLWNTWEFDLPQSLLRAVGKTKGAPLYASVRSTEIAESDPSFRFIGQFTTESALNSLIPVANDGDYCGVGAGATRVDLDCFAWITGAWINQNKTVGTFETDNNILLDPKVNTTTLVQFTVNPSFISDGSEAIDLTATDLANQSIFELQSQMQNYFNKIGQNGELVVPADMKTLLSATDIVGTDVMALTGDQSNAKAATLNRLRDFFKGVFAGTFERATGVDCQLLDIGTPENKGPDFFVDVVCTYPNNIPDPTVRQSWVANVLSTNTEWRWDIPANLWGDTMFSSEVTREEFDDLSAEVDNKQDIQDDTLDPSFGADGFREVVSAINQLLAEKFAKGGGVIAGDVIITGSFEVQGTPTKVESTIVVYTDNILEVNKDQVGTPSASLKAGIRVNLGDDGFQSLIYDNNDKKWKAGVEGSEIVLALQPDLVIVATDLGPIIDLNTINKTNVVVATNEVNTKATKNEADILLRELLSNKTSDINNVDANSYPNTPAVLNALNTKIGGVSTRDKDNNPITTDDTTIFQAGENIIITDNGGNKVTIATLVGKIIDAKVEAVPGNLPIVIPTVTPLKIVTQSLVPSSDIEVIDIDGNGDFVLLSTLDSGFNNLLNGLARNTAVTSTTITITVLEDNVVNSSYTQNYTINAQTGGDPGYRDLNRQIPKIVGTGQTITYEIVASQAGAFIDGYDSNMQTNSGIADGIGDMERIVYDADNNGFVDNMDFDPTGTTLLSVLGQGAIKENYGLIEVIKNYTEPIGTTIFVFDIPTYNEIEGAQLPVKFPDVVVQGDAKMSIDGGVQSYNIVDFEGNNIDTVRLEGNRGVLRRQITPTEKWVLIALESDLAQVDQIKNKLDIKDFNIINANDSLILPNGTAQVVIKDTNNKFQSTFNLIEEAGDTGVMILSKNVTQRVSDGATDIVTFQLATPDTVDFTAGVNQITMASAITPIDLALKYSIRAFNANANNQVQGTFQILKNGSPTGIASIPTGILDGATDEIKTFVIPNITAVITDVFTMEFTTDAINGDRGIDIFACELFTINPVVSTNYLFPQENVEGLKNIPAFLTNNTETFPTFPSTPSEGSQIGAKVTILEATNELGIKGRGDDITDWSVTNATGLTLVGGKATVEFSSNTSTRLNVLNPVSTSLGDLLYISFDLDLQNSALASLIAQFRLGVSGNVGTNSDNDSFTESGRKSFIISVTDIANVDTLQFILGNDGLQSGNTITATNVEVINLTDVFSVGNETDKINSANLFPYFDNTTQTKVRHISRTKNILNENDIEIGGYSGSTGEKTAGTAEYRNINFITVNDIQDYKMSFINVDITSIRFFFYDTNFNFISFVDSTLATLPTGTRYLNYRFLLNRDVVQGEWLNDSLQLELGTVATSLVAFDEIDNTITSTFGDIPEENGVKYLGGDTYVEILDGFIGGLTDYTIATDLASKVDANSQGLVGARVDIENNKKDADITKIGELVEFNDTESNGDPLTLIIDLTPYVGLWKYVVVGTIVSVDTGIADFGTSMTVTEKVYRFASNGTSSGTSLTDNVLHFNVQSTGLNEMTVQTIDPAQGAGDKTLSSFSISVTLYGTKVGG